MRSSAIQFVTAIGKWWVGGSKRLGRRGQFKKARTILSPHIRSCKNKHGYTPDSSARRFLPSTSTMDPPLSPPVHIQPFASTPITVKAARKRLETFLEDFQSRSTFAQGDNAAVTVQLQKLADALKKERKQKEDKL